MAPFERVWVLAESVAGVPTPATVELVSAARSFAALVEVVAWGDDDTIASVATGLGVYGATRVYALRDPFPGLAGPSVASAMASLMDAGEPPEAVLIPSSYDGRDVAGRLSAKLDRPVLANVVGLDTVRGPGGEVELRAQHAIFGGTQMVTSRFSGPGPGLFVIRDKSFATSQAGPAGGDGGGGGGRAPEVVRVDGDESGRTGAARIVARHVEERAGPDLDNAEVVVSGGRGLLRAEAYALVEELASLLGGAAGASRAIVDAGWVPYSHQVGQTGRTVKANVYIACGISGATQHLVGMNRSHHVIAINKDPDAPIFAIADLGVVGDCQSVLPRLIEALRARGGAG